MKLLRKYLRFIAAFLIVNTLYYTFGPTVAWALTAGPTAPEATSFEPVDTTDMVNHLTGDLTYNIPLLEVPGPAGSYPLALSYHAGIQPDEEASWVGLGWSLNPGAINRFVNGYPDDHKGVIGTDRSYWEGGSTTTVSVGLSVGTNIGMAGGSEVTAGLSFSHDTYKGFGVGRYHSIFQEGSLFSSTHGVSYSPYGGKSSSTGISAGTGVAVSKGITLSGNVGVSVNSSREVDVNAVGTLGVSTSLGTLGVSMESNGQLSGNFASNVGQVGVHNSKADKVSVSGFDYSIPAIPLGSFTLSLGASYKRYWIDESVNVGTNGALHHPDIEYPSSYFDANSFDSYDLLPVKKSGHGTFQGFDFDDEYEIITEDIESYPAGTYINYDNFTVSAQGLGGSMRPHHYNLYINRQSKKDSDDNYLVKNYHLGLNENPAEFRFLNDFSNRYLFDRGTDNFDSDPKSYTFNSGTPTAGLNGTGYEDNRLAGSKHIEYLSNKEISDWEADWNDNNQIDNIDAKAFKVGLVRNSDKGFERDLHDEDQIGAFVITNASGVKYHYALPAYSYDEYTYTGRQDYKNKHHFNQFKRTEGYAYTWYLTAITGPDYVDKNQNGMLDQGDWGYWIGFDYGQWHSAYTWRNPGMGFNKDIDGRFNSFSKGKKEIYYLNSIKSATHTALFIKNIRKDGKSANSYFSEAVQTTNGVKIDEGGFYGNRVSLMKLESINLLRNRDIDWTNIEGAGLHPNVLDITDVNDTHSIYTKAIRTIDFTTDYSLSPETINSYYSYSDQTQFGDQVDKIYDLGGKLTLKALSFLGKGGNGHIPPMNFKYDYDNPMVINADVFMLSTTTEGVIQDVGESFYDDLYEGEIIKFNQRNVWCYAYVKKKLVHVDGTNIIRSLNFEVIGSEIPVNGEIALLQKTKNPSYHQDRRDIWGNYKSDYVDFGIENVSRMVTDVSSKSQDVWSLRSITTSLGADIKINYESDQYNNVLLASSSLPIKDYEIENEALEHVKINFYSNNINELIQPNEQVEFNFLHKFHGRWWHAGACSCDEELDSPIEFLSAYDDLFTIIESGPDYAVVKSSRLTGYLQDELGEQGFDCDNWKIIAISTGTPIYNFGSAELLGGEILLDLQSNKSKGGGIRVESINVSSNNTQNVTHFEYDNGITSYEPLGIQVNAKRGQSDLDSSCASEKKTEQYNDYATDILSKTYKNFSEIFANSREIPGPGVFYGMVTVKESVVKDGVSKLVPGYTVYEYKTYNRDHVLFNNSSFLGFTASIPSNLENWAIPSSNVIEDLPIDYERSFETSITDLTAEIGSLRSITHYDDSDNPISKTVNNYLYDDLDLSLIDRSTLDGYIHQGMVEEVFVGSRIVNKDDHNTLLGLFSKKTRFPAIQTSSETINYKTGITTKEEYLAYDFFSGATLKTATYDGYGNKIITETTPAYHIPEYASGMGLAMDGGNNMLSQEASTHSYMMNPTNISERKALISASIQTWNDKWGYREFIGDNYQLTNSESDLHPVWRKHRAYEYKGEADQALTSEGLYTYADENHPVFNSWVSDNEGEISPWEKSAEITLYDRNSHALEVIDINGNFGATKMGYNFTKVLASTSNARYTEMAYSGAEDEQEQFGSGNGYFGGEVEQPNGIRESKANGAQVHTGEYSVKTTGTGRAFEYLTTEVVPGRTYKLSVWMSDLAGDLKYSINNGTSIIIDKSSARSSNGWNLVSGHVEMPSNVTSFEMWCQGASGNTMYFDDFRFQPVDASMTAYVYDDQTDELEYILDNNNLYTKYNYDATGRLVSTSVETLDYDDVKTSEVIYEYARNKVQFDITVSAEGGGTVSPLTQTVKSKGIAEINLNHDACDYNVAEIDVDGHVMVGNSEVIGGSSVALASSKLVLTNIRGDHEIKVTYLPTGNPSAGTKVYFSCQQDTQGCPTGLREFKTADGCGGYLEAEGVYSYEESTSCCDSVPAGCPTCTVNDPTN